MDTQYLSVDWHTYHTLALKLAAAILNQEKKPFDLIVCIGRGGFTLGHMLSDFLQVPISSITIQSYTDIRKQGAIIISSKLGSNIGGKRILLVDDIADSGKTLIRAISYLKQFSPDSVTTATMFFKPHSTHHPDYVGKITKKWILQPFEVTEWIRTFSKKMTAEKKSKPQIQKFLEQLGYTVDQIRFVRRHHMV